MTFKDYIVETEDNFNLEESSEYRFNCLNKDIKRCAGKTCYHFKTKKEKEAEFWIEIEKIPVGNRTVLTYKKIRMTIVKSKNLLTVFIKKVQTITSQGSGELLKKKRIESKLTQLELARLSGINYRMIQSYEQGFKDISKAQCGSIKKLAEVLNCRMEDFFGDVSIYGSCKSRTF